MKKLLYLAAFLPSVLFAGFTTDNLIATSTFTLRTSTIVINGTTYYWRAGTGNSGECLTTDGAVTPALTFGTCGGGGMTPGSTFYIQNTNNLQSGATFYVSSGTVAGNITVGSATISGWSFYGATDDYMRIGPRSSGISLRVDRTENEVNIANATSASPVILRTQNSSGGGTISYTGPTNGYSVNSHVGLASGRAMRFYDTIDSNYVALKASSTISQTNTYVLMPSSGTAGQAILTDGNNNLYFGNVSGGSGTTIRVENQGSLAVNSSTVNFGVGILATNDVGEAKVELNPASYVGNQSWSDGIADPSISVTYNVSVGTPPEWTYSNDRIETLNDLALPDLNTNQPLKTNGSQVIVSAPINLADTTNEVTGVLPGGNLGSGSTNYIQNVNTLQSGATFYVSSGSVSGQFQVSSTLGGNAIETFSFNPRSSTFAPASRLSLNMIGNSGMEFRGANEDGSLYSSSFLIPPVTGNTILSYWSFNSGSELMSIRTGEVRISTDTVLRSQRSLLFYDSDNTNYVALKSSSNVTSNNTYVLPASSGTAGQAILTDGSNNLYFGSTPTGYEVRPATVTFLLDRGYRTSTGTYTSLSPGVMHIVAGSSNVTTSLVSLSTEVTGALGYSNMKFNRTFNAEQAKLPTTSPCVISNAGGLTIPALLCDASSDESVTWATLLTEYTTTTISASIYYTMASTNSGNVVHNISVMCASSTYTADLDTESFGSVNASTFTVPSSIGRLGIATMTLTSMDTGCVQGGIIIFKYTRDANAAADTAPGDIEIRKIWAREP